MIPYRYSPRALLVATAFIPLVAAAQIDGRDPLNSPTPGPTTPYQSAFTEYKKYQDFELMSWRAANDVVREFGSMAQMEGMDGGKATEGTGANSPRNKAGEGNKPVEPAHDMGNMNKKSLPASPKTSAPSGGKPSEMGAMPGHDMSRMNGAPKTTKTPAMPDADMRGMEGMASRPGHDMGNMKNKTAPVKPPATVTKPAAPQAMPDHSGMQKQ